ncbi:MAG: hypothetical protein A2754_00285 [Candidatus Magasanikbacteria bacterium RIFCSPHIGHO2_01_FULL_47_8]|uniref:DUF1059 domain-containing protein n=1 Tax=Candidatus Magasanikbacteria bacterium RIFCSPHIGHO2_01_FULL_47_8 TaxID=1798673 RepID=A0A1F6MCX1_9BACT|nr:MAG: hypothetical protein A2754_00285 [Candidatus Magasanikbacteria bacterium RIFCSPHIGHO2_01_FULL_47_8]
MYTLSCKDLGAGNCPFVAKDETMDGAVNKMMDHARKSHPDDVEKMRENMSDEEITNTMKSKVRQEAAA